MKEFRSIFKQDFADYIETNQGTISNDTLRNTRSVLLTFDSLLAKENTGEISEAIVNQWIKRLHQVNAPKTVSDKVSYLRKFLRYLQYYWRPAEIASKGPARKANCGAKEKAITEFFQILYTEQ